MNTVVAMSKPTKLDQFRAAILPPDKAGDLYRSLPSHIKPEVFERNLINALMANPKLMNYAPSLVFREVSKAAGIGLLLDPILGEAYIIEGYNGKTKQTEPQLRIGYKGAIKLSRQTGNISGIWAHEVHAKDKVTADLGFPKVFHHEPILFGDRGPIIGYVAVITYKDGTFDFEPMSLQDCLKIRDRSDAWKAFKAEKIKSTPWSTDESEMCKKTVLRRLMKRQDQSPEMRLAQQIEDEAEFPHMVQHEPMVQVRAPAPPEEEPAAENAETQEATANTADVNSRRKPKARTTKRGEVKDGLEEVLEAAETPQDPESLLKWIEERLAKITDPYDVDDVWATEIEPKMEGMFPPDKDAVIEMLERARVRLDK